MTLLIAFLLGEILLFLQLFGSALLVFLSFFFSLSETALMSVSASGMQRMSNYGNASASKVVSILENRDRVLGTVLLGNTACSVSAGPLLGWVVYKYFGPEYVPVVLFFITVILVFFGEILPKQYSIKNPEKIALKIVNYVSFAVWLFFPLTFCLNKITKFLFSFFDGGKTEKSLLSFADAIRGLVEHTAAQKGGISDDLKMLKNLADVLDIEVEEVMTHRKHVITIDKDDNLEEILSVVRNSGFSRIPVFDNEIDNIVGIFYVKNFNKYLLENRDKKLDKEEILKYCCIEPWFIPDTVGLIFQLKQFRARKIHFAIVINEFGSFQGIVTLEDLIEEIVGSIYDEHDSENKMIIKLKDSSYIVKGECSLRDLENELSMEFESEDASTVWGFVMFNTSRFPIKGEVFEFSGVKCIVLSTGDEGNLFHIKKLQ